MHLLLVCSWTPLGTAHGPVAKTAQEEDTGVPSEKKKKETTVGPHSLTVCFLVLTQQLPKCQFSAAPCAQQEECLRCHQVWGDPTREQGYTQAVSTIVSPSPRSVSVGSSDA
jgi:hypothetical protein